VQTQIAGQAMPAARQVPPPLQPQRVSPEAQETGPVEAEKRVKPAAVKETVFAVASIVRSALPMVTEGVVWVSSSTPTTVRVSVAVPGV
jgi:hypothetical protein